MKSNNAGNLLLLHFIVLIFGFTGIIGKLITIDSQSLVWWRMLIALISLTLYIAYKRFSLRADFRTAMTLILTGVIIAAHWVTFFEAIKVSTVSVTLACLSTAALYTALIEPFFFKRKVSGSELLMGLVIVGGLVMIFSFETQYAWGSTLGLISAFLAASFTVLNGLFIRHHRPSKISFYEMLGGLLVLSVYLAYSGKANAELFALSTSDLTWLLVLGTICTAFAFVASVKVMETLTPFTVSLSINLEPVYGIILAWFIFGESEKMTTGFYLGAFVILATVFTNSYLQRRRRKRKLQQ